MTSVDPSGASFPENIRLVIWDLDETFWRGTLTEGGAEIIPEHVALVRTLSERGIISSICSKNDLEPVETLLRRHDIWDYFVFPNVSWEPKGPRIQAMLESVNLRPQSVLFIDDNPTNLNEAQRYVPGLNVAPETFIAALATHPNFAGKDDHALSRLKQYKQMEQRQASLSSAGTDTTSFLRESHIVVDFEFDLEPHLDRIIELVNRTNQLNFTKRRLPEDVDAAKAELGTMLASYQYQCALVRVKDDYGDHGFCGFYAYMAEPRYLQHFCFSCRILGLGVEQWIYQKLGRPRIEVQGEVLGDLNMPPDVDWINQDGGAGETRAERLPQVVTTRGGCDLAAVTHYFLNIAEDVRGEYHYFRNGLPVRMDHSVVARQAIGGLTEEQKVQARLLGFADEDFVSRIYEPRPNGHGILLSFNCDVLFDYFQHRATGLLAPVFMPHVSWENARAKIWPGIDPNGLEETKRKIALLEVEYEHRGHIGEIDFMRNLTAILDAIPAENVVFLLTSYESVIPGAENEARPPARNVAVNAWMRTVALGRPNVSVLQIDDFVEPGDAVDHHHFNRMVYFRIFKAVRDRLAALAVAPAVLPPAADQRSGEANGGGRPASSLLQRLGLRRRSSGAA